ncbi:hypothetical protein HRbin09_00061 [bacterium HR09]|nr:hypothetical protein HRbin09_00061 [bacterium HR09]
MKRTLGITLALVFLAFPLWAQENQELPFPHAREVVARFLELTPEQVTQWEALLTTLRDTVAPLQEQLRNLEGQLAELLKQDNPDPAAVGTLVIQIKGVKEAIGQAHRQYVNGFEGMFTGEQTAKLRLIRQAERVMPLIPAFKAVQLVR